MSLGQLKDALQAQGALFRHALVDQSHSFLIFGPTEMILTFTDSR